MIEFTSEHIWAQCFLFWKVINYCLIDIHPFILSMIFCYKFCDIHLQLIQVHLQMTQWHCCCNYFEKLLCFIKNKENIYFLILPSLITSLMFFLSLCVSKFLTYIIFLLSEELKALFARQFYWQQIYSIFLCLKKSLLLFHFWKIIS